ncbi:protein decapping 5-like isoform X2 [Lycium ferocissimum]|uniref:protein decapping 5-like isoform X2 n=1 Tax=Lycium ferocissimum TaxID=112874 RepID=UPI002815B22F|nr:protein decapping 5-like isoform X2 [Lycium ferocissimum]
MTITPPKPVNLYIGSFISLISQSDIRYEGFVFLLNPSDSTIGLRNVKSFGTEGRRKDGLQLLASDEIYEHIFFRGCDIKDLQVISSPLPQSTSAVPDDPAIIQSHFPQPSPTTMASTSHGAAQIANFSTSVHPILPVTPVQLNLPRGPSASSSSFWGSSLPPPPVNISRLVVPNYCPGLVGSSGGVSYFQHRYPPPPQSLLASLPPVQQQAQHQNVNTSVAGGSRFSELRHPLLLRGSTGSPNTLPPLLPTPFVQSNPGRFADLVSNLLSIPRPNEGSSALSSVAVDPGPKMASSLQEVLIVNATPASVINESSSIDPTISQTLSSMTIEEQSGLKQSSSSQSLQTTDIDAKTALAPVLEPVLSSNSTGETLESSLKSTAKTLLGSTSSHHCKGHFARGGDQAHRNPAFTNHSYRGRAQGRANVNSSRVIRRFKEDFDFEAMNEKSNKEEVWDYLGKNNKADADDGDENEKETEDSDVKGEASEVHVKDDSKPVFCKDDSFDSFSCDALDQESAEVTLCEQRKKDAETFGVEIPILKQGHGQGPRCAGASQVSYRGRGHGNARGGRGRGHRRSVVRPRYLK